MLDVLPAYRPELKLNRGINRRFGDECHSRESVIKWASFSSAGSDRSMAEGGGGVSPPPPQRC